MSNWSQIGLFFDQEADSRFCRVKMLSLFWGLTKLKPYIWAQGNDITNLVNSFLQKKILESSHAKFEQIRARFEQGGRTSFARSTFLETPRFELSSTSRRRGYEGSFEKTLGERPFSLVCKGENPLPLSFLVLEKLIFSADKGHFTGNSALIHCVLCVGGLRVYESPAQLRTVAGQLILFICTYWFLSLTFVLGFASHFSLECFSDRIAAAG